MNINATLLVELIVFASFVELTRRTVWPPIIAIIEKRQADQAQGIEDAKQGKVLLDQAQDEHQEIVRQAVDEGKKIKASAEETAKQIVMEAKQEANSLKEQYLKQGKESLQRQTHQAHKDLEAHTLEYMRKVLAKTLYDTPSDKQLNAMLEKAIEETSSDM